MLGDSLLLIDCGQERHVSLMRKIMGDTMSPASKSPGIVLLDMYLQL